MDLLFYSHAYSKELTATTFAYDTYNHKRLSYMVAKH